MSEGSHAAPTQCLLFKVQCPQFLNGGCGGGSRGAISVDKNFLKYIQMIKDVKMEKKFLHLHPTMWTNQITPFSSSLHPEAHIVSSNSLVKKNYVGSMLWWDVIPTYSSRMQAYISHILEKLPKVKKLIYNPQHLAHNRCSVIIFKWMNEN